METFGLVTGTLGVEGTYLSRVLARQDGRRQHQSALKLERRRIITSRGYELDGTLVTF